MSKIHIRSYLDNGAPQFDGLDRTAIIKLFKANFQSAPYITQNPTSIVVDSNSKTMQITFATAPKFMEGQLIQLTGTTSSAFQTSKYRIILIQNLTVTAVLDNFSTVTYPASDNSINMVAKLAALDWEVCWSTATQFSIRSTNPTSSKNVFTLKSNNFAAANTEPGSGVTSLKYATASPVYVSRSINTSTGELIEDFTLASQALYTGDTTTKQVFYFVWNCYSYSYSNAYAGNVPWYIVASDKFFYFIVGNYSSTATNTATSADRNWFRSSDYGVSRSLFYFGDPDFLGDPNHVDSDGTVLSCSYNTNWDSSTSFYSNRPFNLLTNFVAPSSKATSYTYFMRDFDQTLNSFNANLDVVTATITSVSLPATGGFGNSPIPYPNKPTGGLITFPIYLIKYGGSTTSNTGGYLRSRLPFALSVGTSMNNIMSGNWPLLDYNLIKANNQLLMPIVISSSQLAMSSLALFELD